MVTYQGVMLHDILQLQLPPFLSIHYFIHHSFNSVNSLQIAPTTLYSLHLSCSAQAVSTIFKYKIYFAPQVTKNYSEKQRERYRTYGEELSHVKVCTDSRDSLFLQWNVIRQSANE